MKYAMPEVPKNDLVDKDGQRWTNVRGMWWRVPRNKNTAYVMDGYCSWLDLVSKYGPLEDYIQRYFVIREKHNGTGSVKAVYATGLTKEQAQKMINELYKDEPFVLLLKFERDVMFQRKYDGYIWTYTIEEAE